MAMIPKQPKSELKTFDYVFTFGKYKNRKLSDIVSIDPCYINWCISSIDNFNMSRSDCVTIEIACQELDEEHDRDFGDFYRDMYSKDY